MKMFFGGEAGSDSLAFGFVKAAVSCHSFPTVDCRGVALVSQIDGRGFGLALKLHVPEIGGWLSPLIFTMSLVFSQRPQQCRAVGLFQP